MCVYICNIFKIKKKIYKEHPQKIIKNVLKMCRKEYFKNAGVLFIQHKKIVKQKKKLKKISPGVYTEIVDVLPYLLAFSSIFI